MSRKPWENVILASCLLLIWCSTPATWAAVKLPALISDNLVLQQGRPVCIWGRAEKGEKITLLFAGKELTTTADESGNWKVVLEKLDYNNQPQQLVVKGASGDSLTVKNILVGEVWLCSGQSNMAWPLKGAQRGAEEVAAADYPAMRLFQVARVKAPEPLTDVQGSWKTCTPQTAADFSAVAYFFGRELHRILNVPIGLIEADWGGTPAEFWTNRETLKTHPDLHSLANLPEAGSLYHGMIAPLTAFPIAGVIWYQGESNVGRAEQYRLLFPTLIGEWRQAWGLGAFPFLFVQIAPYRYNSPEATTAAELRDAQLFTLQSVPNTGMVVTTDIGEINDIHPKNKQDVGRRLALWALAKTYGQELICSGPIYKSMAIEGDKIRLTFEHLGGGLVAGDGKPLRGFTIAAPDGVFRTAQADIDGDTVLVWAEGVAEPKAVRYGWRNDAAGANLANKAGLPASPFRTDSPR